MIKESSFLDKLCERDSEWRKLALQICGCPTKADDLVQDMYVYLSKYNKEFNTAYVYFTMKQIYIRGLKKKTANEVLIDDFSRISKIDDTFSTQERYEALEMLSHLSLFEREIVLITHEMSLRQAENETGIFYGKLNYHKNKVLDKLKNKYGSTKGQKD